MLILASGTSPPTWLTVLQAVSYSIATITFFVTLWTLALGGFRLRATAYMDQTGRVVLELANVGRLGGYVPECYLVRRKKWRRPSRRYQEISTPRELRPPDTPALLIPAAGQQRLTFPVTVHNSWRKDARVLIRYRRYRNRVLKPKSVSGVFT
jgi:hypothetical protein